MPSSRAASRGSWRGRCTTYAPLAVLAVQLCLWVHFQSALRPETLPGGTPCPSLSAVETRASPELAAKAPAALDASAAAPTGEPTGAPTGEPVPSVVAASSTGAGASEAKALREELRAARDDRARLADEVTRLKGEQGAMRRELGLAGHSHARSVPAGSGKSPFLTLCMPTTPRAKGVDYLPLVVQLLLEQIDEVTQLNRASGEQVGMRLVVMNTRPAPLGDHPAFEEARQRFQGHWSRPAFVNGSHVEWIDPNKFEPNNLKNPKQIPGHSVRHQTHDMVQLLRACASEGALDGEFTVLVEDDFLPCPFGLYEMIRAIRLLSSCRPKADWKTLSLSQGMNGIVVPRRGLVNLTNYLEAQIDVRPPDLLIYDFEWNPGEERLGYRYHLWEHVGDMSSFDFRRTAAFQAKMAKFRTAGCWSERSGHLIAGYKPAKIKRFEDGQALPQAARQPEGTRPDAVIAPCVGGGAAPDGVRSLDAFLEMRRQARDLNTKFLPKDVQAAMNKARGPQQRGAVATVPGAAGAAPGGGRPGQPKREHGPWTTMGVGMLSCSEGSESLDPPFHRGLKTLQACKDACDGNDLCHSFSYHAGTDSCYLKNGCGKPPRLSPADCPAHEWQTYYYEPCSGAVR